LGKVIPQKGPMLAKTHAGSVQSWSGEPADEDQQIEEWWKTEKTQVCASGRRDILEQYPAEFVQSGAVSITLQT